MVDLSLSITNILRAYLPKKGRDEIINQGGLICDVFAAVGKAEKDGDGYRISGKWNFASGCLYSDWIGLGVAIHSLILINRKYACQC